MTLDEQRMWNEMNKQLDIVNKCLEELGPQITALVTERNALREALGDIIDDAQEAAENYSTRMGDYRKEAQAAFHDRVAKARTLLATKEATR